MYFILNSFEHLNLCLLILIFLWFCDSRFRELFSCVSPCNFVLDCPCPVDCIAYNFNFFQIMLIYRSEADIFSFSFGSNRIVECGMLLHVQCYLCMNRCPASSS